MVLVDTRQSEKGGQGEGEGDARSILACLLVFDGDTGAQETRYCVSNIFQAGVLKHRIIMIEARLIFLSLTEREA